MGRFTFPSTTGAGFDIKLQGSQTTDTADSAKIVGNNEVSGSVTTGDFCGESNNDGQSQLYTVYFDIKFSEPFTSSQVITGSGQTDPSAVYVGLRHHVQPRRAGQGRHLLREHRERPAELADRQPGLELRRGQGRGAKQLERAARQDQGLGRYLLPDAGVLQPALQGLHPAQRHQRRQRPVHGGRREGPTLASGQKNQYGIYSGWDIYHTLAQLQAMLDPSAASDQAQSQVNYYSEDGLLQQWGYLQDNNYVMVGDPAAGSSPTTTRSAPTGSTPSRRWPTCSSRPPRSTTSGPARRSSRSTATCPRTGPTAAATPTVSLPPCWKTTPRTSRCRRSRTRSATTATPPCSAQRANNWENTFNPNNDLLNARYENGQFEPGITPTTQQNNGLNYVEGDAYEYLWNVPNDYQALFNLMGGDSKVVPALQSYLSQPNGNGMYDEIANEFDLGEQFGLDYAGDPAGTQAAVRNIENTVYLPGPSGIDNNDDLGAESSSYIWQELGLYPENPGMGTLLLNSPGFAHEQISLSNGRTITVNAPSASSEYYVHVAEDQRPAGPEAVHDVR